MIELPRPKENQYPYFDKSLDDFFKPGSCGVFAVGESFGGGADIELLRDDGDRKSCGK